MARKTIDDCRCEIQRSWKTSEYGGHTVDREHWDVLQYNPRCPFHKGPDKGYGYDDWGRPNSKHSESIGKVGAGIVVFCVFAIIAFLLATFVFGVFG